jgi:hypothetical protein
MEVEKRARRILSTHQELHEFVAAMGVWSFSLAHDQNCCWSAWNLDAEFGIDEDGGVVVCPPEIVEFAREFQNSTPMRFTAAGKCVTHW